MSLTANTLDAFFERSTTRIGGTLPIRKTRVGVWVPTPVPVIVAAAAELEEMGVLGHDGPTVVDAGTGDGRVPAVLAWAGQAARVYGIEGDAMVYAQAEANLDTLTRRGLPGGCVQLVAGDYCDARTYLAAGLSPADVGLFVNYPDGHEEQLARFVAEQGSDTACLCLLTHDRTLAVDALSLRQQRDVRVAPDQDWRLSLYQGTA